jgi:hypothetical protein
MKILGIDFDADAVMPIIFGLFMLVSGIFSFLYGYRIKSEAEIFMTVVACCSIISGVAAVVLGGIVVCFGISEFCKDNDIILSNPLNKFKRKKIIDIHAKTRTPAEQAREEALNQLWERNERLYTRRD